MTEMVSIFFGSLFVGLLVGVFLAWSIEKVRGGK